MDLPGHKNRLFPCAVSGVGAADLRPLYSKSRCVNGVNGTPPLSCASAANSSSSKSSLSAPKNEKVEDWALDSVLALGFARL